MTELGTPGGIELASSLLLAIARTAIFSCIKSEYVEKYRKNESVINTGLYFQDIKFGGTPLHWAKSKELVEALVDSGCSVDAKNFRGDTALHVMVSYGRLDCIMALLSNGADIDAKDNEGEKTRPYLFWEIQNTCKCNGFQRKAGYAEKCD